MLLLAALIAAQPVAPAPAGAPDTTPPAAAPVVATPPIRSAADLLARARVARLRQDSTLRSYEALSRERITATLGLRRDLPVERTVFRQETAARVRWSAATGLELELVGRRRFASPPPFTRVPPPEVNGDGTAPVPYYPGRDPLWIGARAFADAPVDTAELLNPLAPGAERYYLYALGDSVRIRLPGAEAVTLRELRVTPRRADWRRVAGSYWFDARTAQLVRATYRPSAALDLWRSARSQPDPTERPPRWLTWVLGPAVGRLDAVTVEHGLYAGRVWLPRAQTAEGSIDAGPSRMRIRVEQTFRYDAVNSSAPPPARALPPAAVALGARRDAFAREDSLRALARDGALAGARSGRDTARVWRAYDRWRDSARVALRAARDTAAGEQCRAGAERATTRLRYGRRLPVRVFVPCDEARLAASPVFEGPILAEGEGAWGAAEAEALRAGLAGRGAAAAWAPGPPSVHAGLGYTRYNRVEGLSTGAAARQALGRGWGWEANARWGLADRQANAELFAERGLDRRALRAGAYRRLAQADDYGAAFAGGASVQNLVGGLDEQFYYRAAGAELAGARDGASPRPLGVPLGTGRLEWRVFGERQGAAAARARFTVGRDVLGRAGAAFDRNVVDTVPARGATAAGAAARWRGGWGDDASAWRVRADARAEAAAGTFAYVRPALDLTAERRLPAAVRLRAGVGAGTALGALPPQRWWNVGGWQTVRGATAGSRRGDAFWLGRAEAQWDGWARAQPVVFADAGWAGPRAAWGSAFRRSAGVHGAGVGVALLNGLLRVDAARGGGVGGRPWRVEGYAVARW